MCARKVPGCRKKGFTLVEMLVVIVIIGILAGLLTGAVIMARNSARIGLVRSEIGQLELAVQMYKDKYGEYPPDFAFTDSSQRELRTAARRRVIQHIRKRWPRMVIPLADPEKPRDDPNNQWDGLRQLLQSLYPNLQFSDDTFTPASALIFWLGGLPEDGSSSEWIPQGFHSDPTNPFKPGLPREKPLFEFRRERIVTSPLGYRPDVGNIPTGPIVYFRSYRLPQTGRFEYGYRVYREEVGEVLEVVRYPSTGPHPEFGLAVPYLEPWPDLPDPTSTPDLPDPTSTNVQAFAILQLKRSWRNQESFQIIAPGLDGHFGTGLDVPAGAGTPSLFRISRLGARFSQEDYDNIANFCVRTLEDEIE
jgi:prepilin-type N-terminal cleavage/methylation domain-containing protein